MCAYRPAIFPVPGFLKELELLHRWRGKGENVPATIDIFFERLLNVRYSPAPKFPDLVV